MSIDKLSNEQLRQMMASQAINTSILNNSPFVAKTNPNAGAISNQYFGKSIMDYIQGTPLNIRIHKVANGFVLQSSSREGDMSTTHIASTIEELHQIITTELVTKKLEGK